MRIEKLTRRGFIGSLMSVLPLKTSGARRGRKHCIVIHGGAGTILRAEVTRAMETAYHATLKEALRAGSTILESGGASLAAVEAAICVMEDSPLFNAGKGAVFNSKGENELDASIMDGKKLEAGAVAGVRRIKNPIRAARLVMEKSPHVLLIGSGAEEFAQGQGIEMVDPKYFHDERRWKQLERAREKNEQALDNSLPEAEDDLKFGTVGAVALDLNGNLAAGTSTGGMTNKKFGRVGDSPIIGAGTYASNETCAVSCTGHGEFFIRAAVAHDIHALMLYRGSSVRSAAREVILKKLQRMGGAGGAIALDREGNYEMAFNTEGMYRGVLKSGEPPQTFIYKKE